MQKTIVDIVEDVKRQELEYGIKKYCVYNNDKNYYQFFRLESMMV